MSLELKLKVFVGNNEIILVDDSGYYSATNLTGWKHPTGSGSNYSIQDATAITLSIDDATTGLPPGTNDIIITTGSNEGVLPVPFADLLSPGDLVFTLNSITYPSFYDQLSSFKDGSHTITYTISALPTSVSTTSNIFTYKEVEADMWDNFHAIATNNSNIRLDSKEIDRALLGFSMYKGLEFSARTSIDISRSEEILASTKKILDYTNSISQ